MATVSCRKVTVLNEINYWIYVFVYVFVTENAQITYVLWYQQIKCWHLLDTFGIQGCRIEHVTTYKLWKTIKQNIFYLFHFSELKFCVTPEIVTLMRVVIGLIFVMICASLIQMMLDITGPTGRILKCVRKNAVAGIISG